MKSQRGQSLLEVVLVTFLFALVTTGLLSTLLSSSVISSRGLERSVGAGYIQEAIQAVRSIRHRDWSELTNGTHGLTTVNDFYEFTGTSDMLDGDRFTRTITIEDVYRTASLNGDIAQAGVLDAATKRITVNVTWEVPAGLTKNIDAVFYVTNYDQETWVQSLTVDFENGRENSTTIATTGNGEVTLRAHDTNWDETQIQHQINLDGSADRFSMIADGTSDVLVVVGDTGGADNVTALDISDVSEAAPTVIADTTIAQATDVAVANGYAFVSTHESVLGGEIVILSLPTLTQVGVIDIAGTGNANGVDVMNNVLVVARAIQEDGDELVMYNIADPLNPVLIGGGDSEISLTDVVYNGTHIFAVTFDDTQEVLAFEQATFTIVDALDLAGTSNAGAIDYYGTTLYVGKSINNAGAELFSLNITDPTNLSLLSTIEVNQTASRIQVDRNGQYAIVGTRNSDKEFLVVDLSTFTEANAGDASGGSQAESATVFGGHGYIGSTSDSQDITVFRVSPGGWGDAELVGSANLTGNHDESSVWISGNYAYLATENNGSNPDFFVYDISVPNFPTYLGSLDTNSDVNDLVISGNYVYLASKDNNRELITVDVTTKTSPGIVASYNAAGSRDGSSVALFGTKLYVGREDGTDPELYVFDVSTPAAPAYLGATHYSADLEHMVTDGSYVYAATESDAEEFVVFDVTNPVAPTYVTGLNLSGGEDGQAIDLSEDLIALGRDDGSGPELVLIDVSTPTTPVFLGGTDLDEEVSGLTLEDATFVHIASDDPSAQYQRWDITDPAFPTLDATFDLSADGEGIFFNGVYAFVATEDNSNELKIIGPGIPPSDYTREGNFTSQPFDAGANVSWDSIEWALTGAGSVTFHIRTADTQANLASAHWVGSDGTAATSYGVWGQAITEDPNASGRRWFQWKATLLGNGLSTPALEDVTIRYSQ